MLPTLDPSQYVLLITTIVGITELITRLRGKDFWTAVTIGVSAIVGALFGLAGIEGLNVVTGLAAGFAASGTLSAVGIIGNKSATQVRTDVVAK